MMTSPTSPMDDRKIKSYRMDFDTTVYRNPARDGFIPVEVRLFGFQGGDSRTDAVSGRGNAIKLMSEFLFDWYNYSVETRLADINGGVRLSEITKECTAKLWIPGHVRDNLDRGCWWFGEDLAKRFSSTDPDARVSVTYPDNISADGAWKPMTDDATGRILSFLNLALSGVIYMDSEQPDVVDSSCNMGLIRVEEDEWKLQLIVHSANEEHFEFIREKYDLLAEMNRIRFSSITELEK